MAVAVSRDGPHSSLSSLSVSAQLPFLIASASVPDVVTAVEAAAVAQQHVYDLICNGSHSSKFYFIITVNSQNSSQT